MTPNQTDTGAVQGVCDQTSGEAWKPTEAQVRSACLSYRHDFGLLSVAEAAIVKSEAREWLRAWQKEGAGADRNEIIEQCAVIVDQANREGPYQAIAAASRIRDLAASSPAHQENLLGRETVREALRTIARTTFSGSEMGEEYMRGNRDAHATCATIALAALQPSKE